jgi:hypothetical protein
MLEPNPNRRIDSLSLLNELRQRDIQILEELTPTSEDRAVRLVAIQPEDATVLQRWGWVSPQPLSSSEGRAELLEFISDDLSDAWLEHAPDDLTRFIERTDRPEELKKVQFVLRGMRGFYYGELFKSVRGGRGPVETAHVFYIKFTLQREIVLKHFPDRQSPRFGRRVSPLRVVARSAEEITITDGRFPSWKVLLDAVRQTQRVSDDERAFFGALHWLVAYQRVELEARRYPFVRDDSEPGKRARGRIVRLRYDAERDAVWRSRETLRNQFMLDERRRPSFGDFFDGREDRDFDGTVRWWPDYSGDLVQREGGFRGFGEVESVDGDCVIIRVEDGDADDVPTIGWMAPADDDGQRISFERQAEVAMQHLAERPTLKAKLLRASTLLRQVKPGKEALAGLRGERSQAALRRMRAAESIYVLQGPPGTGKTTVVARAVADALNVDIGIGFFLY